MKKRSIATVEDALALELDVSRSAQKALESIIALHDPADALNTLWQMKGTSNNPFFRRARLGPADPGHVRDST